ncbi:DNA replication and repair recF [Gossypium australe]|uniref:DNA replication and repair recF n=1 Tax=Gossypium australe TaxID=47621 RepID=A0A5B6X545_9ROSI|nr:DNA replication and repair recF [Gossypium australe]
MAGTLCSSHVFLILCFFTTMCKLLLIVYKIFHILAAYQCLFYNMQIRSIVSKQVGPCEQGKAQGIISGIGSFANVASPLAFSPLTALFLSERAPFYFPGFSIMCVGFASMLAFVQSLMIRAIPPISSQRVGNCNYIETA